MAERFESALHQLGMDHEKLTYRHAGRDFRLTDVHGKIGRISCLFLRVQDTAKSDKGTSVK
mgnify:FL=1